MKLKELLKNIDDMKFGLSLEATGEIRKRKKQIKICFDVKEIYLLNTFIRHNKNDSYLFGDFESLNNFIKYEKENCDDFIYNIVKF
ncbi:MAG: hypothetical protein ACRC5T_10320 [Cetobacterium sp.]